jgi:hypothetical protein
MLPVLSLLGALAGIFGALLCALAGLSRLGGVFYLWGFETMTFFSAGVGLLVLACLLRLELLLRRD